VPVNRGHGGYDERGDSQRQIRDIPVPITPQAADNKPPWDLKFFALNARSHENEADEYERAFLEQLGADKKLESESTVRKIGGKPYLVFV